MKDKFFIDSNIFLYALTDQNLQKQEIAGKVVLQKATISTQVINEVSSNMLKKFTFSNDNIKSFIQSCYNRYNIANFTKDVFLTASCIREDYSISYYDSLIISSALNSNCTILYSEDMQHNQKIDSLSIINPFM